MLINCFNLSQSFNYTPYLFYKKTVQIRDQFFLYNMDPACIRKSFSISLSNSTSVQEEHIRNLNFDETGHAG